MSLEIEIRWMSPADVKLDENIRKDLEIDPAFIDSIKHQGILMPVIGYLDMLGEVNVHDGQRRVIAAREAGLGEIPVLVGPPPGSDEARILEQFTLNEARSAMTIKDKAAAIQQLKLFGMEPDTIARKVGRPRKEIEGLLAVGVSRLTAAVSEETPDLTLQQATDIAALEADPDFDDEAAAELKDEITQSPFRASHAIQLASDALDRKKKNQELRRQLVEEGHVIVDNIPSSVGTVSSWRLKDERGGQITLEEHRQCRGHRVWIPNRAVDRDDVEYYCVEFDLHKPAHVLEEERLAREKQQREARLEKQRKQEWRSAAKVRKEYLHALISDIPTGGIEWAIRTMMPENRQTAWNLRNPYELISEAGIIPSGVSVSGWANMYKKGAHAVLFASALAAYEDLLRADDGWQNTDKAGYLGKLSDWGYTLSEIEEAFIARVKGTGGES